MFFKQKIDLKAVFKSTGLLLLVPGLMAFFCLPLCLIFGEFFALIPFALTGIIAVCIGCLLYKLCAKVKTTHLWEAMLAAALGWLFSPLFAAIPYIWISHYHQASWDNNSALLAMSSPLNAFFEAFSGFTSTGLSMISQPQKLPYVLQFWRAFTQWVGGVGLIVFVISFLEPYHKEYRLFYAETRSKELGKSLIESGRMIWFIYFIYTVFFIIVLSLVQMPVWEAICHTMTGISTGGFTILEGSFSHYSSLIKIVTIVMMTMGAVSFTVHYKVLFEKDFKILWKNVQHVLLWILFILGSIGTLLLTFPYFSAIDAAFQWVSAMGTCGFSTKNLTIISPLAKLVLIIGMILGGSTGSTVGGIKIRRIIHLAQAIILRIKSFTKEKEEEILKETKTDEPTGVKLPPGHKTERLYEASVLFVLWIFSIVTGWFMLSLALPNVAGIDLLFDVTSAMGNVGLSSGIVGADLTVSAKYILMFIMWLGRLEIIPVLVLFLSPFVLFSKRSVSSQKKTKKN